MMMATPPYRDAYCPDCRFAFRTTMLEPFCPRCGLCAELDSAPQATEAEAQAVALANLATAADRALEWLNGLAAVVDQATFLDAMPNNYTRCSKTMAAVR